MKSSQINNRNKIQERNDINKRNQKPMNKYKEKQQEHNVINDKMNSERLNEENNMEEQNSNNENNNELINSELSQSQDKKPIYVMSLELEDGNLAKIKIYSDSNPEELSQKFCEKIT